MTKQTTQPAAQAATTTAPAQAVATRGPSVVAALAERLSLDPQKLVSMLKKTAFATCKTDEEFMAMCVTANRYGLDPILKEIYAFPNRNGQVVPIVGVDGWMRLMNQHPEFDGIEFEETQDACTAIVYRKDRAHPTRVTEYLAECAGNTEPWRRWPKRMLRHKAMVQAARLAFGFAGIYDEDEGRRIALAQAARPAQNGNEPTAVTEAAPVEAGDKLRAAIGAKPVAPAASEPPVTDISAEETPPPADGLPQDIIDVL